MPHTAILLLKQMSQPATQHILQFYGTQGSITIFTTVTGPYTKLGQFNAQHNLSWSFITETASVV